MALAVVLCFKKLNDAVLNVHILFPDAKRFIDPRSAAVQKPEEYWKLDGILTIPRRFICINRMKISCYFIFSIYVWLKIRLSVADISCHKNMISLAAEIYQELFNPIYPGIGLEGPSWIGAMMALANCGSDKVKFCREYGVEIFEEQWPCYFMPELLTADRGEMNGNKPNHLITSLRVDLDILPPYRADWKGYIKTFVM